MGHASFAGRAPRSTPALSALVVVGAMAGFALPAKAQNPVVQQFNEIRDSVGLGETRAPIDFSERPPLVVPPTNTLPPPAASANDRLPVVDPDIEARRKALSDPRRPVPPSDPGATATGRSARPYLIDPPAGMRDPDTVASEITTDNGTKAPASSVKRHRTHKKAHAQAAQ